MSVRVWVRGGLGNQLCSLAAGATVAKMQNDARLILDGSVVAHSSDPSRRYFLDEIALEIPGIQIRHENTVKSRMSTLSRAARRTLSALHSNGLVNGFVDYLPQDGLNLLRSSERIRFMDGHFEVPELALNLLTLGLPRSMTLHHPSAALERAVGRIRPTDLAVHVRLGDFRTHQAGRMMLDGSYYGRAIDAAIRSGGFRRVRVFSEEPEPAVNILHEAVAGAIEITPAPVRDPQESMYEMSMYGGLVASRSSYSWWAGILGPSKAVFAPADSEFFQCAAKDRDWLLVEA